jgi:RND superfamily putative drug exporter
VSFRFASFSSWSQRHHWAALVLWVVALAGITVASNAVGSDYHDDQSLPGTESQRVSDALAADSGAPERDSLQVVVYDGQGLRAPTVHDRVSEMLGEVAALDGVGQVSDPYRHPGAISEDGTTGYATVTLSTAPGDTDPENVRTVIETAQAARGDGLRVELGGDAVRAATESGGASEGIGMVAALLILVPMFGSVVAAGLPVLTAIFAVGSAVGLIALVSHWAMVPTYAAPMMMLVGLGVGIDYALLIFSRYRGEVLCGRPRADAVRRALDTAGRSVLFAGCTVIIALLGLLVLGLGSLQGLALSVAMTVLLTMVASVTLLPALLTVAAKRLERTIRKHAAKARHEPGHRWHALAGAVQARPVAALVGGLLLTALLAAPALDMRLGFADAGTDPVDTTSRQAYDLLARGFGPGANGPLLVLAEADRSSAAATAKDLGGTAGVADVIGPFPTGEEGRYSVLVVPSTAPTSEATADLVHRLRDDVLPAASERTGGTYLVGGARAATIDFADAVAQRLPYFIGAVVLLSALLLMAVFRSVVIAVKAAALNLVSIAAALGVMTFVYGEGHLWAQPGPIEAFLPVIVFAVLFGLSMDYEVFLLSRMHEEWRRTGDPVFAVREGFATTGGIITAAAAIMIVVFGAFVASPSRMLQQMGLGLAVGVLVDAVVIRCLIVPAVMRLLGGSAWWLPRWLDRLLPTIRLESDEPAPAREEVSVS